MRSMQLRLDLPSAYVHPMHAFVADTPGFRETRLRHWNPSVGERNTLVFFVDGDDPATYTDALAEQPSILDGLPSDIEITVQRIRPYDGRLMDPTVGLTRRQRTALQTAVERGYYSNPRETTLETVAAELGCAVGTAAEHLRKAEATVLRRVVDSGPARDQ